ncbi:hypothetical protein B9Z19DRAFT_1126219 [Tuber borchii]|uniref:Uncharacterized protein n=1 Tax=Tuber borchii TaxID=42251 RepID=A0A2T6ZT77_TUBBO|nr:hypothetical protein B9Z19DRAFT_1126219 [Tuber borchii]
MSSYSSEFAPANAERMRLDSPAAASLINATLRKIEELMFLHKHLQKTMLANGDEMIWKQDIGVRAVVEEFQSEVEELLEKSMAAVKESAEKAVEAINNLTLT